MEWIDVKDKLPENIKAVLCLPEKGVEFVGQYTKGYEIEFEDFDYQGEYDPIEEAHGSLYLKEGWYECAEQFNGEYDEYYIKRNVKFWMPLPARPQQ